MTTSRARKPLAFLLLLAAVLGGCLGNPPAPAEPAAMRGGSLQSLPGAFDLLGNWSRVLHPGPFGVAEPEIVRLTSAHDGIEFPLLLVRPEGVKGPAPVIAEFSPYWPDMTDVEAVVSSPGMRFPLEFLVGNYVPHGYAVALVAMRGTSNAGGCMEALGPGERADVDQTLTWLGTQSWSSGRVAAIGHSQSGGNAWLAASTGNPHLATIVTNAGFPDLFHVSFRNGTNGVFGSALFPLYHSQAAATRTGLHPEHALCPVVAEGLAWSATAAATGDRDPGGFWEDRDLRPLIQQKYGGSVFVAHGLQDWLVPPSSEYPFANALADEGLPVKSLLGQWEHKYPDWNAAQDPASRWDWAEILLAWFERWLKDDAEAEVGPVAQVQDSLGWWRDETRWPPADAVARTLYLAPDDRLTTGPTSETGSVTVGASVDYYPQPLQRPVREDSVSAFPCLGCPRFSTERLEHELRFAGATRVPLAVTPTGPGGALVAHLYVVYPAAWYGTDQIPVIQRLTSGMIDLRFADGGDAAKPVVPGQPLTVRLQLEPADAVVPAGGRLVLELVQSGYGERVPAAPNYPMQVAVGGDRSRVELSVFDRTEGTFFLPPGTAPLPRA